MFKYMSYVELNNIWHKQKKGIRYAQKIEQRNQTYNVKWAVESSISHITCDRNTADCACINYDT